MKNPEIHGPGEAARNFSAAEQRTKSTKPKLELITGGRAKDPEWELKGEDPGDVKMGQDQAGRFDIKSGKTGWPTHRKPTPELKPSKEGDDRRPIWEVPTKPAQEPVRKAA